MNWSVTGLLDRLLRWVRPAKLVPRLSSQNVLALARTRATSEGYDADQLHMVTHREVDGRVVWHVSEPAIGAVLLVEIDDADGEVRFIGRLPGR